jgi:hypothetical protein
MSLVGKFLEPSSRINIHPHNAPLSEKQDDDVADVHTHLHTNFTEAELYSTSVEQRPSWEATRSSVSQESVRILSKPKIHYRFNEQNSNKCT